MITTPTVFVVGAGGSMPYGFPSGRQLVERILSDGSNSLQLAGFPKNEIVTFRQQLKWADPPSIDLFLEHRPEFIKVGKFAIARILIEYENEDRLYNPGEPWYRLVVDKLTCPIEQFRENKLSIITFNYDRSLDHYVFQAFLHRWGKPATQVAETLKNLPIVHVHGQLGYLPWQSSESSAIRGYLNDHGGEWLGVAANGIRIISDKTLDDSEEFEKAKKLLWQAERIYFLGFGYHSDNMRRLDAPLAGRRHEKTCHVRGTCYGMTNVEREMVQKAYNGLGLIDTGETILNLLRTDVKFVFK